MLVGNRFVFGSATFFLLGLAACAVPENTDAPAASIRDGDAAAVGMSAAELADIAPAMQELLDDGRTGGIMTLVARDGTIVHWQAHGWRVVGEDALERNDIFRIYSMTKPIVTTAAMMLVEEGALRLEQPLSEIIPSFSDVQVYDEGQLRPPQRPLTIRDLMRHTSGLTYGLFGNHPVDLIYRERLNLLGRDTGMNTRETADAIAAW